MRTYEFYITIVGTGKDKEEAWQDACEGFSLDYDDTPCSQDEYKLIEINED